MRMKKKPICPHCKEVIKEDDIWEYDEIKVNGKLAHREYAGGTCPVCKKEYEWYNVYVFAGISDFKEWKE